jgi:hypothetical protein
VKPGDKAAAELKASVAKCELCGCLDFERLQTHEILRGCLRRLARGHRCCSLVLCDQWANNCHHVVSRMSWEKQLLILWRSRPEDMNVFEFWSIAGRRKPSVEELLAEVCK